MLLWVTGIGVADDEIPGFNERHQAGVRLGAWDNRGDVAPECGTVNETGTFETDIKSTSFYFEAFFAYRLAPWAMGEISLGTVNRGRVTIAEGGAEDFGNLVLYPMMMQLKLYPLFSTGLRLQPYLTGGGGLFYGRRTVQFTNASYYYSNWEEESGTDFNYVVGGGFDWPISNSIGVDLNFKYMPINFSKTLLTIDSYDAIAISVGVKYMFLR